MTDRSMDTPNVDTHPLEDTSERPGDWSVEEAEAAQDRDYWTPERLAQRGRLEKALEIACRGGYVPELPLDLIAARLIAADVRVGPDEGLRAALSKIRAGDVGSTTEDWEVIVAMKSIARAALEGSAE